MATASDLITRALKLIGVVAAGETPAAEDSNDGLSALNAMLDTWRTQRLMVYATRDETLTMTGAASYTVGPSGNLNTTRPVAIESAYWRSGDVDYPVEVVGAQVYDGLAFKATTGNPDWIYWEESYPQGRIYPYPVPSSGVLHLRTWVPFSTLTLASTVALPPGYEEAIVHNLAIRLAPEFQAALRPEVVEIARTSLTHIKTVNKRIPVMQTGLSGGRRSQIESGE